MGPYCPHRLQGRAPFPYFLAFLSLIFAIIVSASYIGPKVVLHEPYRVLMRDVMVCGYLGRPNSTGPYPVAGTSQGYMYGGSEDSQFGNISCSGNLNVLLDTKREVAVIVEARLFDPVTNSIQGSLQKIPSTFSPQSNDSSDRLSLPHSKILNRLLSPLSSGSHSGQLVQNLLRFLQ